MKALVVLLVISSCTLSVTAQEFKPGKTTDKYGLSVKDKSLAISSLQSPTGINAKVKKPQIGVSSKSMSKKQYVLPQTINNMPCIVPNTKNIAPIPNALSLFAVPDIAAIPNPALRVKKDVFNSSPSR
jgi:hypothetical protein